MGFANKIITTNGVLDFSGNVLLVFICCTYEITLATPSQLNASFKCLVQKFYHYEQEVACALNNGLMKYLLSCKNQISEFNNTRFSCCNNQSKGQIQLQLNIFQQTEILLMQQFPESLKAAIIGHLLIFEVFIARNIAALVLSWIEQMTKPVALSAAAEDVNHAFGRPSSGKA